MNGAAFRHRQAGKKLLAFDDFNRADSASLGTSPSGHLWTNTSTVSIKDQQVNETGVDRGQAYMTLPRANLAVSARFMTPIGGLGLILRRVDGSNYYVINWAATTMIIVKIQAGAATYLQSTSANIPTPPFTMGFSVTGNIFRALVNGAQVLQATDSSIPVGYGCGIHSGSNSPGKRWDDFRAYAL